MKATLPVASLLATLPVENVKLQGVSVRFTAGCCAEANGNTRLTLTSKVPRLDLSNGMLGKPQCDRDQLPIPLLSQSTMEHADIRVSASAIGLASAIILHLAANHCRQEFPFGSYLGIAAYLAALTG